MADTVAWELPLELVPASSEVLREGSAWRSHPWWRGFRSIQERDRWLPFILVRINSALCKRCTALEWGSLSLDGSTIFEPHEREPVTSPLWALASSSVKWETSPAWLRKEQFKCHLLPLLLHEQWYSNLKAWHLEPHCLVFNPSSTPYLDSFPALFLFPHT